MRLDRDDRIGNSRQAFSMFVFLVAAAWTLTAEAQAPADVSVLDRAGCNACHLISAPRPDEQTVERHATRKGPDLFYSGAKYRSDWLAAWLAEPRAIRPAGLHPGDHTKRTPAGDVLDSAPAPHPRLASDQIDEVVKALAALDWGSEMLPKTNPELPAMPRMLAELNFSKFKGCGSCHRVTPDGPPLSGPDLFDAWARLRPEFLASFIAKPQAWDPVAPMPDYGLAPAEVGKLMEYLRLLSEDGR
ncbi:MAG: hypothetical protein R3F21_20150 [Myxococcota bacterium]